MLIGAVLQPRNKTSNGEQRGRLSGAPAHRFCLVRHRRDRGGGRGADRLGQHGRAVAQAHVAPVPVGPTRRRGSLTVRFMRHLGGPACPPPSLNVRGKFCAGGWRPAWARPFAWPSSATLNLRPAPSQMLLPPSLELY